MRIKRHQLDSFFSFEKPVVDVWCIGAPRNVTLDARLDLLALVVKRHPRSIVRRIVNTMRCNVHLLQLLANGPDAAAL